MSQTVEPRGAQGVVLYACSGCSDAGELADRTARTLSQQQLGAMSCLAGIGGRVKPLIREAQNAEHIVVIDGCPLNCAKHTLAQAGFTNVHHLELHRLGERKGSCPLNEERLARTVAAGAALIRNLVQTPQL